MSAVDDKSLLAMKAVGMSVPEIAWTLKWTEEHVDSRFGELKARMVRQALGLELRGAAAPKDEPALVVPDANRVRTGAPKPTCRMGPPRREGEGMVLRTFHVWTGGYGAMVLLHDGSTRWTEVGHVRPQLEELIQVEPGIGCYRRVSPQPQQTEARAA